MTTDQWTPRVDARSALAEALLEMPDAKLQEFGLLRGDLGGLRDAGYGCKAADRGQKEDFATSRSKVTGRKEDTVEIDAREDGLRDRLPLVVADLKAANNIEHGRWLGNLSFSRLRLRELTPPPSSAAPSESERDDMKKVERVERGDMVSRFNGLDAFCQALLKPGREAIVDRMAVRGLDRQALEKLSADAAEQVKLGAVGGCEEKVEVVTQERNERRLTGVARVVGAGELRRRGHCVRGFGFRGKEQRHGAQQAHMSCQRSV